jgi:DnaK suppressor protein
VPETTATNADAVRAELQKRRRAILETTRRAAAELDALRSAERDPEFEEGAQTEHEAFTLSRLGEAQRRELQQIDAAIARLEAGEYGMCVDCEQEIDPRRLKALPYALLCAECATRRERAPGAAVREPPTL